MQILMIYATTKKTVRTLPVCVRLRVHLIKSVLLQYIVTQSRDDCRQDKGYKKMCCNNDGR
jgi:hypothetical protein